MRGRYHSRISSVIAGVALLTVVSVVEAVTARMELDPDLIRMGESAQLRIVLDGVEQARQPELPNISGLRISGPSVERSFSMQTVNGRMEQQRTLSFRYSIIPLRPGDYEIGPIEFEHEGQRFNIEARHLKVVMPGDATGEGESIDIDEMLFARLSVSRDPVFVSETFTLILAVYSRDINLGRDLSLSNMPESGLQTQQWQEMSATREMVGRHVYDVRRYRTEVRPMTSGTIRLEPRLRVNILVPRSRQQQSFFGGVFSNMEAHPHDLIPEPLDITVRSLPEEGRPEDFTGGVGRFSFDVRVHPTDVEPGDPITITMRIEGDGNMHAVGAPSIEESDLFRVYPPRIILNEVDRGGSRGRKIYEQVIIPRTSESYEVPALTFSYFDPEQAVYRSIVRGPYTLNLAEVAADTGRRVRASPSDATHVGTRIIGEDIAYLMPAPSHWRHRDDTHWYQGFVFWGIQVFPVIALIGLSLWSARQRALSVDVAKARRYRAPRAARAGLKKAEQAMRGGDEAQFFEGLWETLASYFGDYLNWPIGAITSDAVHGAMQERGLPTDDLNRLHRLFGACDQRRFAQVKVDQGEMQELLFTMRTLLKACEKVSS